MRKIAGGLVIGAFVLCAAAAQAAGIDVGGTSSAPMAMTIVECTSNADCATGAECLSSSICIDDITSEPTGLTCTTNEDCEVGSSCEEVSICMDTAECESDADCIGNPNGELCDLGSNTCVECFTDEDCGEDEYCRADTNTCRAILECELKVRPKKIKISNKQGRKPFVVKGFRISGNENFDPKSIAENEDFDLGPIGYNQFLGRKKRLQIQAFIEPDLDLGFVELRFGDCFGEVELK